MIIWAAKCESKKHDRYTNLACCIDAVYLRRKGITDGLSSKNLRFADDTNVIKRVINDKDVADLKEDRYISFALVVYCLANAL